MALFKILKGKEADLANQPITEGWAWFTEDRHNLYIDISDTERVQVNADSARALWGFDEDGTILEIDIDDIFELQENVKKATSQAWEATLTVAGWALNDTDNLYHQAITLNDLSCGSDGTIPPVISYLSNVEDYSLILDAIATPGEIGTIDFTIEAIPTAEIKIVIIDVK